MEKVSRRGWWSEDLSEWIMSLEKGVKAELNPNVPKKRSIRFEDGQLEVLYLVWASV